MSLDDAMSAAYAINIQILLGQIKAAEQSNDALTRLRQGDDILILSTEVFSEKGSRSFISDEFVSIMNARCNGKPKLIGGCHEVSGVYYSLPECLKRTWVNVHPVYEYFCKGLEDEHVSFSYSKNKFSIKLSKLSSFTESRYHALIQAIADDDIFIHNARKPVTAKRLYNSTRQIVLRDFYIDRYEWGLTSNASISAALYPSLKGIAQRVFKNTFYMHDSKWSQCKIKVYNITAANDSKRDQYAEYRPGDQLKFEITYLREFFREHPDIRINSLTFQNDIAMLLLNSNKQQLKTHLLDKLNARQLRQIFDAARVTGRNEFMNIINDDRTTQVSTDARISQIKRQVELLSANQDILSANQLIMAEEIASIKDFVGYKNSSNDSRKLRAV